MDLDIDTLVAHRVLGRGALGTVFLVSSPSSAPFALKVVDKRCPRAKPDSDRRARWELSLLSRLPRHPFLPSLLGSLETPSLLAYAFPFCPAGDLNSLRHSLPDSVFTPSALKFYLSEVLTALSLLHSSGIAYRDLKPENVLLSSDGHVVLSDFDLSKHLHPKISDIFSPSPPPPPPRVSSVRHRRNLTRIFFATDLNFTAHLKKAKSARVSPVSKRRRSSSGGGGGGGGESGGFLKSHSFVGTEEYVAPEIIRGEGHGFAVDFWALGVLAYEMAYGRTPFKGGSRKETFRNVLTRQPEFVGRGRTELTDLVARLLAKDPARRLGGGGGGGAEEVKRHPFFRGVRWEMLADVSRPPFFATAEELEEAGGSPPDGAAGEMVGFNIREYFEKLHSPPPESSSSSSLTEF